MNVDTELQDYEAAGSLAEELPYGPTLGWVNPLAFRRSLQEAWGYTAEVSEYRKSSHAGRCQQL